MSRVRVALSALAFLALASMAVGETSPTVGAIDTSDWDWGAAAPEGASVRRDREPAVAPAEPGGGAVAVGETHAAAEIDAASADEPAPAESAGGSADWDWDSFVPMDESPKVRKRQVTKRETDRVDALLTGPRAGKTAEPDFSGDIRPAYALFPDAPAVSVIPSVRDRDMHPCSNCHAWTKSDLTPRRLKKPHDNFELEHGLHGKGKFWCFTCHTLEGKGGLRSLEGQELDFNEAYVLCSQCHAQETRDWVFGAHGKRVANWRGERQVYNCTACHYQHGPAIEPREAMAGPVVRQALERPAHWVAKARRSHDAFATERVWERYVEAGEGEPH